MLERLTQHLQPGAKRPALVIDGRTTSWGALASRVAAIQAAIESRVPGSDRIVAVAAGTDVETYASLLAILFAGHAYLPVNPAAPAERNATILNQAGAALLLSPAEAPVRALAEHGAALPWLDTAPLQGTGQAPVMRSVPPGHRAYVLFTSGSTGTPKGVPISRGNLDAFLEGLFVAGVELGPDDRVLQMFDLTFDFSVMSIFAPWVMGASIYPAASQEMRFMSVYRLLDGAGITCAPMVPSALTFLRPYFDEIELDALKSSVFCGEPLLDDITAEWARCAKQLRILNFYGPTEATVFCSVYEWTPSDRKAHNGALSIGRPMKHCRMALLGDDGRLVTTPGETGEICLAGEQLTTGYLNDPQRNREAFVELTVSGRTERYYRTGDVGYVDADGDYLFQGRADQQVKVNGFRIELGEIEHAARAAPGVGQAVAVVAGARGGGAELVLCLENFAGDEAAVLAALRERLPSYMVPARIARVPVFELNRNGKIDRPKLRALVQAAV